MDRLRVPGVAVAVVDPTGPVFVAAYGYADRSQSARVDPMTVFEAASLGKPLFASSLLKGSGDLQFDIDKPIDDYLRAPIVSAPESGSITGRHLLSHSSEIAFSESSGRRYLAFRPGTRWSYSGLGYLVLQQAIEELRAEPLEDLAREAIVRPLNMVSTSYRAPDAGTVTLATGHDRQGREIGTSAWPTPNAASSLHTSVDDYARFLSAALAGGLEGHDPVYALMIEPQVSVDSTLGLSWGLGWAVAATDAGDRLFFHWGSNPGYKSLAIASLGQARGMVVLTNGDNGLELATALVPLVFDERYPFLNFPMLHPDD